MQTFVSAHDTQSELRPPPDPTHRRMMMAHDQAGPPPAQVSEETRRILRTALESYIAQGDMEQVRGALHQLAAEGRERGARAEQLLVLLKEIWYGLPSVQRLRSPEQQSRLLQRVVTVSIQAYYDVAPPAG